MLSVLRETSGNPSSLHAEGFTAKKLLTQYRREIAETLSVRPTEIFFTSGGTEGDNWAIKGYLEANPQKGGHIITSAVEHHAVLETVRYMKSRGFRVTVLPVDDCGRVSPEELRNAISEDTALISIMAVNNETGVKENINGLSEVAGTYGIAFHSDCVQAPGHISLDFLPEITMASFSAHKFGGPRGVGFLYVKEGTEMTPLLHGGGQEQRLRSGTENVPGIAGMARALSLAETERPETEEHCRRLGEILLGRLRSVCPDFRINGGKEKISSTISLSFRGVEAASLLVMLDLAGICCSGGSACTSVRLEPSHVLTAMGLGPDESRGTIRISLSGSNTEEEMEAAAEEIGRTVNRLRENTKENRE